MITAPLVEDERKKVGEVATSLANDTPMGFAHKVEPDPKVAESEGNGGRRLSFLKFAAEGAGEAGEPRNR
jgi:hypothetical protein